MPTKSAGILLYRIRSGKPEVFLVHPGGPFYRTEDHGTWSIPKGEYSHEDPETAARREFLEETGVEISAPLVYLGDTKLRSGKIISCWTAEGDAGHERLKSNTFEIEWPPRSGKTQSFPEVDKAAWFPVDEAEKRIHPLQRNFLFLLSERLKKMV